MICILRCILYCVAASSNYLLFIFDLNADLSNQLNKPESNCMIGSCEINIRTGSTLWPWGGRALCWATSIVPTPAEGRGPKVIREDCSVQLFCVYQVYKARVHLPWPSWVEPLTSGPTSPPGPWPNITPSPPDPHPANSPISRSSRIVPCTSSIYYSIN